MDIIVHLLSPDFSWLWVEIGKNACLSLILAFPLAIASKKKWPIVVALFIGVFAIDLHGYPQVLSELGFGVQRPIGRTIVNSYGFELFLVGWIYIYYSVKALMSGKTKDWKVEEKNSLLILSVACGFQANIFIDTLAKNDELFYEPLTTFLKYFFEVRFVDIPESFLGMYIAIFLSGICIFSWKYWQLKNHAE
jgi:hypothetical protein